MGTDLFTGAAPVTVTAGPRCRRCGATGTRERGQVFADGSRHRRIECAACGAFIRYQATKKARPARRPVNGAALLLDVEDELLRRVIDSPQLSHLDAGKIGDEISDAVEAVRVRHGLSGELPA